MIRRTEAGRWLLAAAGLAALPAAAAVLTGEVRSVGAQQIITPQSNSAPVVIRYFVPEGAPVKAGEVVLRIDPGQSATMVPDLEAKIEQANARAAKEVAELEVKALDAELELVDADSELLAARLDAGIPKALVSGLDYDRYQGELERTRREAELKRKALATARAAIQRRQQDGELEVRKLSTQRDYYAALMRTSEIRAERAGIVVHGFNTGWLSGRIDEGSSSMPGSKAGEVVSGGEMSVRAWALEPDRRGLVEGQRVDLSFDALPGRKVAGRITHIAGAPDRKPEWGEGRYFTIDIDLETRDLPLLPGMSVRVLATPPVAAAAKQVPPR
jgi:multidrug resistance efflux pump